MNLWPKYLLHILFHANQTLEGALWPSNAWSVKNIRQPPRLIIDNNVKWPIDIEVCIDALRRVSLDTASLFWASVRR